MAEDHVTTRFAKDHIGRLVDRAALGERITVMSRKSPLATLGPAEDLRRHRDVPRVPTTEIKTGRTSIKGILARSPRMAVLTVRGAEMASVRPASPEIDLTPLRRKVDEIVDLLRTTQALQAYNEEQRQHSRRLREFCLGLADHAERVIAKLPASEKATVELQVTLVNLRDALFASSEGVAESARNA